MSEEAEEKASEEASEATELKEREEREELKKYIEEMSEKIKLKTELREKNLNRVLPQDSFFSKLDSSLKKNTAFVKKLKQFTAAQLDSLLKDMATLNLTKYITEVSQALVEAKLKMSDVSAVIILSSHIHQTYAEFSQHFFDNWQKALTIKSGERVVNLSKLRVDLRLYCEILSVGIFSNKVRLKFINIEGY